MLPDGTEVSKYPFAELTKDRKIIHIKGAMQANQHQRKGSKLIINRQLYLIKNRYFRQKYFAPNSKSQNRNIFTLNLQLKFYFQIDF